MIKNSNLFNLNREESGMYKHIMKTLVLCGIFLFFLINQLASSAHATLGVDIFYLDPLTCPTITMHVKVTDQGGASVYGLTETNFVVTEDGVEKTPITVKPLGVIMALALDYSGSMGVDALNDLKTATKALINDMLPDDELELIKFESSVVVLQPFTSDQAKLINAIDSSGDSGGGTAFFDATYRAVQDTLKKRNNPNRVVIAMTDGQDNSSAKTADDVINFAKTNSIPIYTVGLGGYDQAVMERIANETGGQAFFTQDSAELAQIFQDLLVILRDEYVVTYETSFMDYTQHTATVEANHNGDTGSASFVFTTCPYGLPTYYVTITKTGDGFGNINATGCTLSWLGNIGTCKTYQGFLVTLSGQPFVANVWEGWSNVSGSASGCNGLKTDCSFNIASDSAITGSFYKATTSKYTLTLKKSGNGSGNINVVGCSPVWVGNTGTCSIYSGITVTVSGVPNVSSSWLGWSGSTGSASACTGTSNCSFLVNSDSEITGIFDSQASGSQAIRSIAACNINNDSMDDIVKIDNSGNIFYSTNLLSWNQVPYGVAGLDFACDDLNTDRFDDYIVVDSNGSVWYQLNNGSLWTNILSMISFTKVFIADINGDGKKEIVGLDNSGKIFVSYDLTTWTSINGNLAHINVGNYNISKYGQEIAGINIFGQIYYMADLNYWVNIAGNLTKLFTGDINGDGKDDLIGLNSSNELYYSTNLMDWIKIPGSISDLAIGDLDGDGRSDIVGINNFNVVYYTLNLKDWYYFNTPKLSKVITGDINGDGKSDILGIGVDGKLYYSTNLQNWMNI